MASAQFPPIPDHERIAYYIRETAELKRRLPLAEAASSSSSPVVIPDRSAILAAAASGTVHPSTGGKAPRPHHGGKSNRPIGHGPLDRPTVARKTPVHLRQQQLSGQPRPLARKMPVQQPVEKTKKRKSKFKVRSDSESDSSSSSGSDSDHESDSSSSSDSDSASDSEDKKDKKKALAPRVRVKKDVMDVTSDLSVLYPPKHGVSRVYLLAHASTARQVRVDTQFAVPFKWYKTLKADELYAEHFGDASEPLPVAARTQVNKLMSDRPDTFLDPAFLTLASVVERLIVSRELEETDIYFVDDRVLSCLFSGITESQRTQAWKDAEEALFQLLTDTTEERRQTILASVSARLRTFVIAYLPKKWGAEKSKSKVRQTEFLMLGRPGNKIAGYVGCPVVGNQRTLGVQLRDGLVWEHGDPIISARTVVEVRPAGSHMTPSHEAFMFLVHHMEVWATLFQSARIAQFFYDALVPVEPLVRAVELLRTPESMIKFLYKPNKNFYKPMKKRLTKWADAITARSSFSWPNPTEEDLLSVKKAQSYDLALRKPRKVVVKEEDEEDEDSSDSEEDKSDSSSSSSSDSEDEAPRKKKARNSLTVPRAADPNDSDSSEAVAARDMRNQLREYDANGKQDRARNVQLARMDADQLRAELSNKASSSSPVSSTQAVEMEDDEDEDDDTLATLAVKRDLIKTIYGTGKQLAGGPGKRQAALMLLAVEDLTLMAEAAKAKRAAAQATVTVEPVVVVQQPAPVAVEEPVVVQQPAPVAVEEPVVVQQPAPVAVVEEAKSVEAVQEPAAVVEEVKSVEAVQEPAAVVEEAKSVEPAVQEQAMDLDEPKPTPRTRAKRTPPPVPTERITRSRAKSQQQ